jgi:phage shock protein A
MNCSTLLIRVTVAMLLVFLVGGCDRDNAQHQHDEIAQLEAELEQLGNQVGRLEFRIFELEAQLSAAIPTADAATEAGSLNSSDDRSTPVKTADGNYDLTPIE